MWLSGLCCAAALLGLVAPSTSQLVGAFMDTSLEPQKLAKLIAIAEEEVNRELEDEPNLVKVVRVLRTRSQVVTGVNYRLRVRVGKTRCEKGEVRAMEVCDVKPGQRSRVCDVVVYQRPWDDFSRVTRVRCL
ncbi:unnamed protein product [Darwinula stevensoni]|uniref:Cystatin domain-containing protein n=1 Tax=Darwinula stevensoni TaxID=69355 RepID=A0A7R9AHW2_9CRUS|nr:unnamed protein product [Darwinula stevensoni]CAG0905954.1 unnamed protein product [Darwinula stevensoni]